MRPPDLLPPKKKQNYLAYADDDFLHNCFRILKEEKFNLSQHSFEIKLTFVYFP